jgi:hypothetical protein
MSTGDISKSKTPPAIKWGSAITFAIIGISGSIRLITIDSSPAGLLSVTLVSLCALLIIFFGDSVDWFDLKNLKVQMRKVEEARKEVEEREREVARIALAMAELTNFIAAFQGRFGDDRSNALEREWLQYRTRKLLLESGVSGDEMNHASRWVDAINRMDSMKDTKEGEGEWGRIWDRVEQEIKEANKTSHATTTSRPVENVLS